MAIIIPFRQYPTISSVSESRPGTRGTTNSYHEKIPPKGEISTWCNIVDVFQTAAIDATEDYRLKHLVEQFRLSGKLLDA